MNERFGNDYLEFPSGTDGRFPDRDVERRVIVLGHDTTNTCNIGIGDADGDGLDEIATPLTLGEQDCVRLYRGDGTLVWDNPGVPLYHAYYGDTACPSGGLAHLWHRMKHRHVLTEIVDFDRDGTMEVVVGDGPVHVLDARTGDVKSCLDLGGRVALWNVVHDPTHGLPLLIATVDDRQRGPRVTAWDANGSELWSLPTPGKGFCDCMHHGDLNNDGRPEVGFSVEEAQEFWLIDCDGRRLWRKHVPSELGDDPHIDDFLVDQILPVDRLPGKQVLLVTGPNLVDRDGRVIWSARDRFDHAQKVLAADLRPEIPGKEVYTVESFKRRAHLLSCDADAIWTYENFTRVREGVVPPDPHRGQAIGRLTTAGDLVNWSGRGKVEIAQAEMGGADVHGPRVGVPPHAMRWFLHVIDRAGQPVQIFPIDDSPMCVRSAHVTASPCDDLVVVGHTNSRICIYSRKC